MKFKVKRVENHISARCQVCGKKLHIIPKKKSIISVTLIDEYNGVAACFPWFVCSNVCANIVMLRGEEYAIYGNEFSSKR